MPKLGTGHETRGNDHEQLADEADHRERAERKFDSRGSPLFTRGNCKIGLHSCVSPEESVSATVGTCDLPTIQPRRSLTRRLEGTETPGRVIRPLAEELTGAEELTDVTSDDTAQHPFIKGVHGVRYQVKDVARSVAFYTQHLGFTLGRQQLPAFANVSFGGVPILLSGPGASGSRPMPGGLPQEPGGWNRVVLRVVDLPALIAELKAAGVRFRNEMETGPGGRQIQIEDPDGNPIELFEPAR